MRDRGDRGVRDREKGGVGEVTQEKGILTKNPN